jgi:glycine cleavage system aminomethyltransferase T
MGYVFKGFHTAGTEVSLKLKGNRGADAAVTKMPFVPQQYYRA